MKRIGQITIGELLLTVLTLGIVGGWSIVLWANWEALAIAQADTTDLVSDPPDDLPPAEPNDDRPKILKFDLTLSEPADLKVAKGDLVEAGQALSDRTRQRELLLRQKGAITLSIKQIKAREILDPIAPLPVNPIAELQPANYEEEERAIATAARLVDLQERKVDAIGLLVGESVPPVVMQHEQVVLEDLRHAADEKRAALSKAQSDRQAEEYRYSVEVARRQEEANQARLSYGFQLQASEQQRRDRDFQLAQLEEKLRGVEGELGTLSTVIAPYDGVVRRIKWLGQKDNELNVEVTIGTSDSGSDLFSGDDDRPSGDGPE